MTPTKLSPRTRLVVYLAWSAASAALAAYGVALPGGADAWEQIVCAVLGVGNLGVGALAIKHIHPPVPIPIPEPEPGDGLDPVAVLRRLLEDAAK